MCPRKMLKALDGDPTGHVVALNNWHKNTSCKYNNYCTFLIFVLTDLLTYHTENKNRSSLLFLCKSCYQI